MKLLPIRFSQASKKKPAIKDHESQISREVSKHEIKLNEIKKHPMSM